MSKKLKYRKGRMIRNLGHLEICLQFGNWIYLWNRPKHPRVIECMTLGTLKYFIDKKGLWEAILN